MEIKFLTSTPGILLNNYTQKSSYRISREEYLQKARAREPLSTPSIALHFHSHKASLSFHINYIFTVLTGHRTLRHANHRNYATIASWVRPRLSPFMPPSLSRTECRWSSISSSLSSS